MIGWTLYAAVLIAGIGNAVLRFAPAQLRRAAIVLVVLCLLLRAYRVQRFRMGGATILGQQTIRAVKADLDRQGVNLPHGATVISIGDPFAGTYDLLFLLRLYARDPTLEVEHAEADDSSYGLVLKWSGAHLTGFTNRRR
jgi:hypothetical protein